MIDLNREVPIRLNQARSLKPLQRDGKRPDLTTLYRWATRGVRGVVLETVQVGASRCTTAEAVTRFIERLSNPDAPATARTLSQRSREIEHSERRLEAAGI